MAKEQDNRRNFTQHFFLEKITLVQISFIK